MATRRKKKTVKETSYKVATGRDEAGTTDIGDETVDADNSAQAVEKAMKGDPRADDYNKVVVKKDTHGGHVRTKPQTISKVKPQTKSMTGFESVDYPYNLALPMGFKPLFESLTKKVRENLIISGRYGKLHIQVPDATTMSTLMTEIEKKARGKTDMKHIAGAVVNGITESVNK